MTGREVDMVEGGRGEGEIRKGGDIEVVEGRTGDGTEGTRAWGTI